MGYPCKQDLYDGKSDKFIVFTYEDERAAYYADDEEQGVTLILQVQLIVPRSHDYFADKSKLKAALRQEGFTVVNNQTWLDDPAAGTDYARRVIFSCEFTGADN